MSAVADEAWSAATADHPVALAFDPTGRVLAVADAAGSVVLLEVERGTVLATHAADPRGVLCLAWHPHARRLAVGGQAGVVRVYGDAGLQYETSLTSRWIEHLAWEPSGGRLAVAQSRTVSLLGPTGARIATSEPQASTLTGLAYRAGGRQLLTSCYGGVAVHDPASLAVIRRFKWTGSTLGLALSPNDRIVACGGQDSTVHFWRFADGHDAQMSGYPNKPKSLSWSSDSRWLATSGSPDVIVWPFDGRGPEGRAPLVLRTHDAPVEIVGFAPEGPGLVSACAAGVLALWVPGAREEPLARRELGAPAVAVGWARDGEHARLAVADARGVVRSWTL